MNTGKVRDSRFVWEWRPVERGGGKGDGREVGFRRERSPRNSYGIEKGVTLKKRGSGTRDVLEDGVLLKSVGGDEVEKKVTRSRASFDKEEIYTQSRRCKQVMGGGFKGSVSRLLNMMRTRPMSIVYSLDRINRFYDPFKKGVALKEETGRCSEQESSDLKGNCRAVLDEFKRKGWTYSFRRENFGFLFLKRSC